MENTEEEEEREKVGKRVDQASGVNLSGISRCRAIKLQAPLCPGQERPHLAAPCAAPGFPSAGISAAASRERLSTAPPPPPRLGRQNHVSTQFQNPRKPRCRVPATRTSSSAIVLKSPRRQKGYGKPRRGLQTRFGPTQPVSRARSHSRDTLALELTPPSPKCALRINY